MQLLRLGQIAFIVLSSTMVYAFVATAKDGENRRACAAHCAVRPSYAGHNKLAPDFELPNLSGKPVKLSSFRGKTVILNFWSKTCPPCLEEMPSLKVLAHSIRNSDRVVLLTVTTDESAEDAKNTLTSVLGEEIPFEVLIDPDGKVVGDKFGTKLYPETWFIDPKGVIAARIDGARDYGTAAALDLALSFHSKSECALTFRKGQAEGPLASICSP